MSFFYPCSTRAAKTLFFISAAAALAFGVDGIAVSAAFYPHGGVEAPIQLWRPAGAIVKLTIKNTSVQRCDTIFSYRNGMGEYPAINFDGTKVAFFRWNIPLTQDAQGLPHYPPTASGQYCNKFRPDTNWISVVNTDGTGLRNLVMVDPPDVEYREGTALLDWPYGDWVYYEKPTKSREIWRVNVNDPLLNELVVKFSDSGDREYDSLKIDFFMQRFSLSYDTRYAAMRPQNDFDACSNWCRNIAFIFPPDSGIMRKTLMILPLNGCNPSVSASGKHIAHYTEAGHQIMYIETWDSSQATGWQTSRTQFNVAPGGELIRWSANSDQWLMQSIGLGGETYQGWEVGGNQHLANPVTKTWLSLTHNAKGSRRCNEAGDFWIQVTPDYYGKYEDWSGNWISVKPAKPVDRTPPATPTGFSSVINDSHSATLSWSASIDNESGVAFYRIYRNNIAVDTVHTISFTDTGLSENTQYSWTLSAVNGNGIESSLSAPSNASTPVDIIPPSIAGIDQYCGSTLLRVIFDEPIQQSAAENAQNYSVTGLTITRALLVNTHTVELSLSSMKSGVSYTVHAQGIPDRSKAANVCNTSTTFLYQGIARGLIYSANSRTGITSSVTANVRGSWDGDVTFQGLFYARNSGEYRFLGLAEAGFKILIDNKLAVELQEADWQKTVRWGKVNLTAGYHPMTISYFDASQQDDALFTYFEGPDGIRHRLQGDVLFYTTTNNSIIAYDQLQNVTPVKPAIRICSEGIAIRSQQATACSIVLLDARGSVMSVRPVFTSYGLYLPTRQFPAGTYITKIAGPGIRYQGRTILAH